MSLCVSVCRHVSAGCFFVSFFFLLKQVTGFIKKKKKKKKKVSLWTPILRASGDRSSTKIKVRTCSY